MKSSTHSVGVARPRELKSLTNNHKKDAYTMKRREFVKQLGAGAVAGGAILAAPAIKAKDNQTRKWKMVTTWPKNFPALGTGANDLAKLIG
jgi:hypothetical protein